MKRVASLLLTLTAALALTGCPRYDTVRKLSTEQLRVQQDFQSTMTKYFASMEQFADNQILVDRLYYDSLLRRDLALDQEEFDEDITKIQGDTATSATQKAEAIKKRSIQFGEVVQTKRNQNNQDKAELDSLLQQYKNKNKEILATYQAILEAQSELDRYIQLKKLDEVVTDQLLSKLRVNQQKLTRLFDETANVAGRLRVKQPGAAATPAPSN